MNNNMLYIACTVVMITIGIVVTKTMILKNPIEQISIAIIDSKFEYYGTKYRCKKATILEDDKNGSYLVKIELKNGKTFKINTIKYKYSGFDVQIIDRDIFNSGFMDSIPKSNNSFIIKKVAKLFLNNKLFLDVLRHSMAKSPQNKWRNIKAKSFEEFKIEAAEDYTIMDVFVDVETILNSIKINIHSTRTVGVYPELKKRVSNGVMTFGKWSFEITYCVQVLDEGGLYIEIYKVNYPQYEFTKWLSTK